MLLILDLSSEIQMMCVETVNIWKLQWLITYSYGDKKFISVIVE